MFCISSNDEYYTYLEYRKQSDQLPAESRATVSYVFITDIWKNQITADISTSTSVKRILVDFNR